ncbi:hypothetical protein [Chelativorans sp. YIM 93263]|uniref:hypothetical protein n=1 Tax=Chelativorans sp. YIM 93263 TaxID=2906648 RepID=UPI002378C636|nr:hypothetical protein [Chelativorans sp. YIM 93263]
MSQTGIAISIPPLSWAARHGRVLLIAGLAVGIALPGLAVVVKPWLSELVALLLFLGALRVGPRQALGASRDVGFSIGAVAAFQLFLPVAFASIFLVFGWHSPLATGLVLMAAAAPISGSPQITAMLGHDPAPSLRLLVVGTALLPLTIIPAFWQTPALDDMASVFAAAGRLFALILVSTGLAFFVHRFVLRAENQETVRAIDGLSAIVMAVMVVGLMSAVGPAITGNPAGLALNLAAAFGACFALQIATALFLRIVGKGEIAVPVATVMGNRNIALFLTALPATITDPLLLFIGCYQIPMFSTPILLRGFYRAVVGRTDGGRQV